MSASVPFAIDVLSRQAKLLDTPGIAPATELGVRLSVVRVRRVMTDMEAGDIADADNWQRLGDLVDVILKPAAAAAKTIQPAE